MQLNSHNKYFYSVVLFVSISCTTLVSFSASPLSLFVESLSSLSKQEGTLDELLTPALSPLEEILSINTAAGKEEHNTKNITLVQRKKTELHLEYSKLYEYLSPAEVSQYLQALKKAEDAFTKQSYVEALTILNKLITITPFYDAPYFQRAKVLLKIQQNERALQDLSKTLQCNPSHLEAYILRANVRKLNNEYGLSLADYRKALLLKPNNDVLHTKKGDLLLLLQDYKGAMRDYIQAIQINPHKASYYLQRGTAYVGMRKYKNALSDYNQAIQNTVQSQRVRYFRTQIFEELENTTYKNEVMPITVDITVSHDHILEPYDLLMNTEAADTTKYHYIVLGEIKRIQRYFSKKEREQLIEFDERHQYKEMIIFLQEHIAKTQATVSTRMMLGYAFYKNKDYLNAVQQYTAALEIGGSRTVLFTNLTSARSKIEKISDIISSYQNMLEENSTLYELNLILSKLYALNKQYQRSIKYIEETKKRITFIPLDIFEASLYLLHKDYEKALTLYQKIIDHGVLPDHWLFEVYYQRAYLFFVNNEYQKAYESLNLAQQYNSRKITTIYYKAVLLYHLGNYNKSIQILSLLLQDNNITAEEKAQIYALYGNNELAKGDLLRARLYYTKAIQEKTNKAPVFYYNRGLVRIKEKEYTEAIKDFTTYLQHYPDNYLAYIKRAHSKVLNQDMPGALLDYKTAQKYAKNTNYLYINIANAMYLLGSLENALRYYQEVLENDTKNPLIHLLIGTVTSEMGRAEDALTYYSSGIKLDPKEIRGYILRGMAYAQTNNIQAAIAEYDTASALSSNNYMVHVLRGAMRNQKTEYRKAITDFTKAIELNPLATDAFTLRGFTNLYLGNKESGTQDIIAAQKIFTTKKDNDSAHVLNNILAIIKKDEE
ncbi:MAG: tetratricopeptide repeat protein [Desulfovibrionaceae bacterium]